MKNWALAKGWGLAIASLALACSEGRGQNGGGTVLPASKFEGLYAANADQGTIARVDVDSGKVQQVEVGKEPARLASNRSTGRIYVTLRGERAIAVLNEDGDALSLERKIATGPEPYGIASQGDLLYVAVSQAGHVAEIDAASGETKRTFAVDGEPRWIALHPNGRSLYVGSAYRAILSHVDLASGAVRRVPLSAQSCAIDPFTGRTVMRAIRITGDLAVSPEGDVLAIPVLESNNVDVIAPSPADPADVEQGGGGAVAPPPGEQQPMPPGSGGGYDSGRFNPMVVTMPIDTNTGVPDSTRAEGTSVISFNPSSGSPISGYPSSVAFVGEQGVLLATLETAQAVVALRMDGDGGFGAGGGGGASAPRAAPPPPGGFGGSCEPGLGFGGRGSVSIAAPAGPRGVALTKDGRAYVHSVFDRNVSEIDLEQVEHALGLDGGTPIDFLFGGDAEPNGGSGLRTDRPIEVAAQVLPHEIEQGRRLFFSSIDSRMSSLGSGVACANCHFEGRNDGLTWNFTRGPRQTPSLAGDLRAAQPVGWAGLVDTVAEEVMLTSQTRMGGSGLSPGEAAFVEAFINSTRDVDLPLKGESPAIDEATRAAITRGKALFERPDVGCFTCHNGPRMTNNLRYDMFGLTGVKTRPLIGVAATAPYLHDGSAATLRDVLEKTRDGEMGTTGHLTGAELDDLEAYLKSL